MSLDVVAALVVALCLGILIGIVANRGATRASRTERRNDYLAKKTADEAHERLDRKRFLDACLLAVDSSLSMGEAKKKIRRLAHRALYPFEPLPDDDAGTGSSVGRAAVS